MRQEVILLIGACGQIGTVLLPQLQEVFGIDVVIASDIRKPVQEQGIFEQLDATDAESLAKVVEKYKVTQVFHMAALLSAKGELNPLQAWELNMKTLLNVLEVARTYSLHKVFLPSSIAVFGKSAEKDYTSQYAYLDPSTVYGISKVAAENWAFYYHKRYGLDVRSLRYPGVISYQSMPGGGTTDYAVEMYHKAVLKEPYSCFLHKDTKLPMIYMDDAIRATLELMGAPNDKIKIRTSYNLAGMSFTPAELQDSIRCLFPDFTTEYNPDFRQDIADTWPKSIDDSNAKLDWNWKPEYDLPQMTKEMITQLSINYAHVKQCVMEGRV